MWGLIDCLHKIKTTDPEFLRKIYNFDLLFLVETHLGPDHNISKIGSYYCNLICRPKTKEDIKMFTAVAYIQCIETKCQVDVPVVYMTHIQSLIQLNFHLYVYIC
jgi:hypothetical protein